MAFAKSVDRLFDGVARVLIEPDLARLVNGKADLLRVSLNNVWQTEWL